MSHSRRIRCPRTIFLLHLAVIPAFTAPAFAAVSDADKKSGVVECTDAVLKDHNPGLAADDDRLIRFAGYISNFNTQARDTKPKYLGVPHWVAHHVKKSTNASPNASATRRPCIPTTSSTRCRSCTSSTPVPG